MSDVLEYDGPQPYGAVPHPLRYTLDDELGLLWCAPDLIRLANLKSQNTTQLVDYAPSHTKLISASNQVAARYTSHPVVMHWLLNRPHHHEIRTLMDRWAKIRKFPIVAAPDGMPEPRKSAVDALARGKSAEMPTPEQKHVARFHQEALLCDRPVNLLFMSQDRSKPDDLEPWVSWVDACAFLPARYGLTARSHVEAIQKWFKLGSRYIDRVRGANGDMVIVVSMELFERICSTYNLQTAYVELVAPDDGSLAKVHVWRSNATRFGNRRKEFRSSLETRPTRKAPPRRNEYESARRTPAALQRQDWTPNSYENLKGQERARQEAEDNARNEMGSYEEMMRNIKPE